MALVTVTVTVTAAAPTCPAINTKQCVCVGGVKRQSNCSPRGTPPRARMGVGELPPCLTHGRPRCSRSCPRNGLLSRAKETQVQEGLGNEDSVRRPVKAQILAPTCSKKSLTFIGHLLVPGTGQSALNGFYRLLLAITRSGPYYRHVS